MTFTEWWKLLKPAECDEVKEHFENCWKAATAAERERCAKVCDAISDEHWSRYKGTKPNSGHPARGSYYAEGMSDGAGLCADAIRSGE